MVDRRPLQMVTCLLGRAQSKDDIEVWEWVIRKWDLAFHVLPIMGHVLYCIWWAMSQYTQLWRDFLMASLRENLLDLSDLGDKTQVGIKGTLSDDIDPGMLHYSPMKGTTEMLPSVSSPETTRATAAIRFGSLSMKSYSILLRMWQLS